MNAIMGLKSNIPMRGTSLWIGDDDGVGDLMQQVDERVVAGVREPGQQRPADD